MAMRAEERIAQLEAENAALCEQLRQLQVRLAELEVRLAKDSHNSSKPPSICFHTESAESGWQDFSEACRQAERGR
jgi:hypothetical protein